MTQVHINQSHSQFICQMLTKSFNMRYAHDSLG